MPKYKNFETKNPALSFTFEYPETGWTPVETTGHREKYDQIYLRGPVDPKVKFTTIINITVKTTQADQGLTGLMENLLTVDSDLAKYKVIQKGAMEVAGEKALSALTVYEQTPLYRTDLKPVQLKKRLVLLIKGDRSYKFTITTLASQDDTYAPIFEHVLKTFKFTQ